MNAGLQPYQREPRRQATNSQDTCEEVVLVENPDTLEDNEWRTGDISWCRCGECNPMATVEECICCHEISNVYAKIGEENLVCVVQHHDFDFICLHPGVLRTAIIARSDIRRSELSEPLLNEAYRHQAYRQL
ncbi:uncharacterized protein LOC144442104 [Glandiceps talaboti]